MPKKVQEADLPKDNYLNGYKPITPNFATDEAPPNPSPETSGANIDKELSSEANEYSSIFLTVAPPMRKERKTCISEKHYRMINNIVERLKTADNPISMVGYLSIVLEEHFKKYGKTIKELINKAPQRTEFDEF